MISYRPTADLSKSADITYQNMRSYYERYSVDWNQPKILDQIGRLKNWDILLDGEVVGVLRLEFDHGGCYLRDLQVSEPFQNKGIGAAALTESFRLAREYGAQQIRLRVFKISSARNLYIRFGFEVVSKDDRFFNMVLDIA